MTDLKAPTERRKNRSAQNKKKTNIKNQHNLFQGGSKAEPGEKGKKGRKKVVQRGGSTEGRPSQKSRERLVDIEKSAVSGQTSQTGGAPNERGNHKREYKNLGGGKRGPKIQGGSGKFGDTVPSPTSITREDCLFKKKQRGTRPTEGKNGGGR